MQRLYQAAVLALLLFVAFHTIVPSEVLSHQELRVDQAPGSLMPPSIPSDTPQPVTSPAPGLSTGPASSPSDAATHGQATKKFVYLINSRVFHPIQPPLVSGGPRDVIWRTFGKPVEGGYPHIFAPEAGWTRGRNLLLERAIDIAATLPGRGYLYYIFLDDDTIHFPFDVAANFTVEEDMHTNIYERFEHFLETFEPAMGHPSYGGNTS